LSDLVIFIILALISAALLIAGTAVMAGTGPALLVGGGCAAIGAGLIGRGIAHG
jgi:hypothetical protein